MMCLAVLVMCEGSKHFIPTRLAFDIDSDSSLQCRWVLYSTLRTLKFGAVSSSTAVLSSVLHHL